jgi:hypothetical protein
MFPLHRPWRHLLRLDHFIQDAELQRLRRGDEFGRQHELHGPGMADLLALRPRHSRQQPACRGAYQATGAAGTGGSLAGREKDERRSTDIVRASADSAAGRQAFLGKTKPEYEASGRSSWFGSGMAHHAGNSADFLRLPNNGVIELGTRVEI